MNILFSCPFQQRREEFERHIREQEEELIQQANELKERKQRLTEEEEEEEETKKQTTSSSDLQSSLSLFNYRPSYFVPTSGLSDLSPDPEMALLGVVSDGSVGMTSPVPGSTSWESDLSEIELVKGTEGLGFSLLDFAVSDTGVCGRGKSGQFLHCKLNLATEDTKSTVQCTSNQ